MYYSYIHSHLVYGLPIWGPSISKANLKRLTTLQKKAIRIIANSRYNAPTNNLFKQYKILKIEDLIKLELTKYGYMLTNSQLPQSICELFKRNSQYHNYNTRSRNYPSIPVHTTHKFNQSFLCAIPKIWQNNNNLMRSSPTLTSLTSKFKKSTLDQY